MPLQKWSCQHKKHLQRALVSPRQFQQIARYSPLPATKRSHMNVALQQLEG